MKTNGQAGDARVGARKAGIAAKSQRYCGQGAATAEDEAGCPR